MRFLHLSDIHFLRKYHKAEKGYNSIFNNMTNPVEQIKSCLKKVDLKTIDFIIITGDLVESGSAEDYKILKYELDRLFKGIPYVVTLGNHDNKEAFYKGWFNKESNKSYNVVKEIGDLRIISFDNSNYKNSDGFISKEQYEWINKQLKTDCKKDTILMLHHHLLKDQFTTPSIDFDDSFEEVINSSDIIGIFTGHTHHPFKGVFADKPYFTAGSLSFVGYDENNGIVRFEEYPRFSLCKYKEGKISVEVISALDESKLLTVVNFKE